MNQILPILLVAVLLARDALARPLLGTPSFVAPLVAGLGPCVVIVMAAVCLRRCDRSLARGAAARGLRGADRTGALARIALLVVHAVAVLGLGWLDQIRARIGDVILIDELIALVPPVAGLAALSALHYPIERRVRDALTIRQLDLGQTIYRMPTRRRYVWMQLRTNVLFLLVPVLVILGGTETIRVVLDASRVETPWLTEVAALAVGLVVFACAPIIARIVLTVQRLPDGPLREDLSAICRTHGVRVRELLLWRTDGTMINAAVMGIAGPVRYVLLTDALAEALPRLQLQAVMAHEIGHVRRHHMPWLAVVLLALIMTASTVVSVPLTLLEGGVPEEELRWLDLGASGAALLAALFGFGWVSRRFERQADTFAVTHLSAVSGSSGRAVEPRGGGTASEHGVDGSGEDDGDLGVGTTSRDVESTRRTDGIEPVAIAAMQGALGAIARLNCVDPDRRSWRHGSIAWRQAYLETLSGRPNGRLPIDRLVARIKIVALLALVAGVVFVAVWEYSAGDAAERAEEIAS